MLKKYWWIGLIAVAIAMLYYLNLEDKQDVHALVDAVVKENNLSFRNQKAAECRAAVLEKANLITDSIMLETARRNILTQDSLIAPERPGKPNIPAVKSQLDTAKVKPLFDKG